MKRYCITALFFCLTAGLFAQEISGTITELTGSVEIKHSASGTWVPARRGDVLRQNSFISTGFKSTAILSLGDSTLIVRPLTRLSLGELLSQPGQDSIRVNLRAGRVRVQVKPPAVGKVDFVVHGPTATASVRGTVFDFDTSNLTVYAGQVDFSTAFAPGMAVNAGSISMLDEKSRTVTPPVAAQALSPTPPLETAALGAGSDAAAASIRSGGSGSASDGGIAVGVNW